MTAGPTSPGDKSGENDLRSSSPAIKEIGSITSRELSLTDETSYRRRKVLQHRPPIAAVVSEAITLHANNDDGGKLSIVSCGPSNMADDARSAVVRMMGEGHGCVDFLKASAGEKLRAQSSLAKCAWYVLDFAESELGFNEDIRRGRGITHITWPMSIA